MKMGLIELITKTILYAIVNEYVDSINNTDYIFPYIFNHKSLYHNERDLEIYSTLPSV